MSNTSKPTGMESPDSSLTQLEFDLLAMQERQRLLDEATFTPQERRKVGKVLICSVLQRIGKHRECCESQARMAKAFSVTREWINNCIKRLEEADVITVEFKWNEQFKKTLNHYRVNWTELLRRSQREIHRNTFDAPKKVKPHRPERCEHSPGSVVSIRPDRCEHPPGSIVSIRPDRCEHPPGTVVSIRPTEIEQTFKEDNQTTKQDWLSVVSFLESNGVGLVAKAVEDAKKNFATPEEALEHLEGHRASKAAKGLENAIPGTLRNQCQHPTPLHIDAPKLPPRKNYITHTHWEDNNRCSLDELQRVYPGRPLEPRLQAMLDSMRKEVSA